MGPWAAGFFRTEAPDGTDQYVQPSFGLRYDGSAEHLEAGLRQLHRQAGPPHEVATVAGPWLAK